MTQCRTLGVLASVAGLALVAGACSSGESLQTSSRSTSASALGTTSSTTGAPISTSTSIATSAAVTTPALASGRHVETFTVQGTKRTAVVVVPKVVVATTPLVLVFHGHGGTGANIERKFDVEGLWPEAIVVYPYGLVGHAGKTDPTGVKTGWQTSLGESGDRDLAFYDVMLASVRSQLSFDTNRVYAMGHSNGAGFVSLLLNQRGAGIAATANLSGPPSARIIAGDPTRSMFLAMGRTDPIVPFANQQKAIPLVERQLGADLAHATVTGDLRSEKGRGNLELETYIYPGGHEPPAIVPRLVVEFFRRHTLATG